MSIPRGFIHLIRKISDLGKNSLILAVTGFRWLTGKLLGELTTESAAFGG
jgi:hypothetical protein